MITTRSISQSAIKSATDFIRVSANNIANINTDNYKKYIVHLKEAKNGGVNVSVTKNIDSSNTPEPNNVKITNPSNVNLAEESVNQILAENQLKANVTTLKTSIEMEKEILDILV